MKCRTSLTLERLEDRDLLATFGVPWPNAQHLTLSAVPDGTSVDGYQSNLFQSLNSRNSARAWGTEILRAFQTWAVQANINIGIRADDGLAIGASGPIQNSLDFGDMRLAAHSMPSDLIAMGTPYDLMAGSRSGDIVLNTAQDFGIGSQGQYDLYSTVLHEAGHALGIDDSMDSNSIMHWYYGGTYTGLADVDIASIRALYGARAADGYEGVIGNNSAATASVITQPEIVADVTTLQDVDYFRYVLPSYSSSTVTVRVQTAAVSLLAPRLTVFNSLGQVVGTASSNSPFDGGVSVQITNALPGATYSFKVESGASDVFGIGGYRLKINSGAISEVQIAALDALYSGSIFNVPRPDWHTNDAMSSATDLTRSVYQLDGRFNYAISAGIETATDNDYYKVVVPAATAGQPVAMQVSVAARGDSGLFPMISVYNQAGAAVPAEILVNDHGSYLVQIEQAVPQQVYFIKVGAGTSATGHGAGAYLLGVDFSSTSLFSETLLSGTFDNSISRTGTWIGAQETQVTHLALSNASSSAAILQLLIYDANNNLILNLAVRSGDTVTRDIYLAKGNYKTFLLASAVTGTIVPTLNYSLRVHSISDPIDPPPIDPGSNPPPPPDPPIIVVGGPPPDPLPDPPPTPLP